MRKANLDNDLDGKCIACYGIGASKEVPRSCECGLRMACRYSMLTINSTDSIVGMMRMHALQLPQIM